MKRYLPDICTVLLVTAMVLCAEVTGNKEIIFPEITALAVGYLVAPKRSWMVNGKRMLILITGCAILGVLIVRYLPLGVVPEIILAFVFAQILFMYSGTTFAPFVSAIVLPVMLRTETFVYPIAAFSLTLAIILLHNWFRSMGLIADEAYVPVKLNTKLDVIEMIVRILLTAVLVILAFSLNMKYIVAPPLLVAFTEFSRPRNKTRDHPVKAVSVLTGCAIVGAALRWSVHICLGLPLTLAAFLTAILVLLIVHRMKMYMPPAGAIAILSMLIPEEAVLLFPVQILIGSTCIMFLSRLIFMRKQEEYEHTLNAD